jgi:hypothetical protein
MPATIFSGDKVKALKKKFKLGEGVEVISTNSNPSSGAGLDAPLGSIASNETTGTVYRKSGALATAWTEIASSGAVVSTISKSGSPALTGNVTFSQGSNVTLTQTGQDIQIAASGGGSGGVISATISTSTAYTSASFAGYDDIIILVNATGTITVTLPAANTVNNRKYTVKKISQTTGNNVISVNSSGGNLDGQSTVAIANLYESLTFVASGTQYYIV